MGRFWWRNDNGRAKTIPKCYIFNILELSGNMLQTILIQRVKSSMIVFLCKKSLSCVWGFASYKDTRYKYLNTFILAFLHAAYYTLKAQHICIFACLLLDSSWLHSDWCFSVQLYLCDSRENRKRRKRQNSVSAIPRIWIAVTCLFIGKSEFLSKRTQEESRQNWFNTKNDCPIGPTPWIVST